MFLNINVFLFVVYFILGGFALIDKPYEKKQHEWRLQYFIVWVLLMMFLLERIIR